MMGYRFLNFGEVIKEGDECDICNDGWRDKPKWVSARHMAGKTAPDPAYISHTSYRRKVKPTK